MMEKQFQGFINTPNLWDGHLLDVEQFDFPVIDLRLFSPNPIPRNIRLGHQIEYIFHQLIEFSGLYEILLFNLPIRNENRTIGEIDFILKNRSDNSLLHIELTYKFYLIDETIAQPINQLIGPNRMDSFYDKITKIKNKQFKLLQKEEATNELKNNSIEIKNISSKACFKAQLFIPFHNKEQAKKPFKKKSIYGFWIRKIDFKASYFYTYLYYLPIKKEWLIEPHIHVPWKTHIEISLEIDAQHNNSKSPMVWLKNAFNVMEKAFVVWW